MTTAPKSAVFSETSRGSTSPAFGLSCGLKTFIRSDSTAGAEAKLSRENTFPAKRGRIATTFPSSASTPVHSLA